MKLIKRNNPNYPLFPRDFERLFNAPLSWFSHMGPFFEPLSKEEANNKDRLAWAELYEDDKTYYFKIELPGVQKEAITVNLENSQIHVAANRQEKTGECECSFALHRSVAIPDNTDTSELKAEYADGVLTITLPKIEASQQKRQIPVTG